MTTEVYSEKKNARARTLSTVAAFFFLSVASAFGYGESSSGFSPEGVSGSAGAGFAVFKISSPSSSFDLDQGIFASLSVEKGFGYHLYAVLDMAYLTGEGAANYNYTTLGGNNYTGTDVQFRAHLFQPALGLKLKLIDNYWFRPYVQGGGVAGFFRVEYSNIATKVSGPGTEAKPSDTLLDFGYYAEGGIEIAFSEKFGVRAGARYTWSQTRPFETLGNQRIKYRGQVYYFSLLMAF